MKLFKAIAIIFFVIIFQTSFIRLNSFFPVSPDFPIIALFLLSYRLSFANIAVLSFITGIFIDLFSIIGFGVSSLALVIIFAAVFFLRENIFQSKTRGEFVFSGFLIFFCYYPLVTALDYFLAPSRGANFIPVLLSNQTIGEIIFNFFLGLILYYVFFIRSGNRGRKPAFIRQK